MTERKTTYLPLIFLTLVTGLMATAIAIGITGSMAEWMGYFMGVFLGFFSLIKFFDLPGFVEGFSQYDIVAVKIRLYGFIYPFIELFLSLSYLGRLWPYMTYVLTCIVMLVSIVGVIRALKKGLKLECACMGTVLKVPLSTVTLVEDLAMLFMASIMLLKYF